MTNLLQLSRLLYRQWRSNPAMAIALLIINACKRRSDSTAQNADVALTTVDVTYLQSMNNVITDACPLYAHHRHICAWQKKPRYLHVIVLSKPNAYF